MRSTPGAATPGAIPRLYKISVEPVAGATTFLRDGTELVRYLPLDSGNVYEYGATTTVRSRVSHTSAPGLKEVLWGEGGAIILARFLSAETDDLRTYHARVFPVNPDAAPGEAVGELYGQFLDDDIRDIAVSPDAKQFFYFLPSDEVSTGVLANFAETDKKTAVKTLLFPSADWRPVWPEKNTLVLTTRPSASAEGFSYAFTIATGGLKKLVGGVFGLVTLPSRDLSSLLYSRGGKDRADLFVLDTKTAVAKTLPVGTLAEKCVWSEKQRNTVYCAVPELIPRGEYPDDWYQGTVSFSDALWVINTETLVPKRLSLPRTEVGETVDAINLLLSKDGSFLFFINKNDSSLWSLQVSI